MSFLLKVRCHLLDVSRLAWSFGCHRSGQVSSSVIALPPRPSPLLEPCSCLASVLTLLRWVLGPAQGRGRGRVAVNGLGKEECSFWHGELSCSFSPRPSSPGWSWARLCLMLSCPFSPSLCLGSPTTFHELWKCKNPSDFWSEPFLVSKGKIIQGSSFQEDFGVFLISWFGGSWFQWQLGLVWD